MDRVLRVLIIDDSGSDAQLVNAALKAGGFSVYSERVETADSLRKALVSKEWDIVICDYIMPALSVMEALSILGAEKVTAPVIIMTGVLNAEVDIAPDLIKAGASDFISKYELPKLVAAVEREVSRDIREVEGIIKLEEKKIVRQEPESRQKRFVSMKTRFMKVFTLLAALVAACSGLIAVMAFAPSGDIAHTLLPVISTLLIIFVFLAAAALFWRFMSDAVLAPAREIQASVRKMASGDLGSKISVEDNGEIGALAYSFDEMRESLKETFEKLKNEVRDRYFAEQALQALHLKLTGWVSELDKRTHEITILNQMGKILQSCKTVEEFHVVSMRYLEQLFPGDYGAVYLYNESGKFMEAVCMWGKETIEHGFVPDECWSLRSGHAYTTEGNETLNMLCGHIGGRALKKSNVQTACVPMTAQGETIGMFHLRSEQKNDAHENMTEKRRFAKEQMVVAAAEHITIALSNLKLQDTLRQQSIHDSLTGLFNRRYMKDTLEREIYRAKRHNIPFGIIMADIDFFKKYNDVYGHDTGDMVLEKIGQLVKMIVRPEDIPCRYGGEEFLIILPGEDSAGTNTCALRLQEEIRRLSISNREKALKGITMSIGISAFPLDGETVERIVKAADNAMFKAKENGRDCIVAAAGLLPDKPDIYANPENNS